MHEDYQSEQESEAEQEQPEEPSQWKWWVNTQLMLPRSTWMTHFVNEPALSHPLFPVLLYL